MSRVNDVIRKVLDPDVYIIYKHFGDARRLWRTDMRHALNSIRDGVCLAWLEAWGEVTNARERLVATLIDAGYEAFGDGPIDFIERTAQNILEEQYAKGAEAWARYERELLGREPSIAPDGSTELAPGRPRGFSFDRPPLIDQTTLKISLPPLGPVKPDASTERTRELMASIKVGDRLQISNGDVHTVLELPITINGWELVKVTPKRAPVQSDDPAFYMVPLLQVERVLEADGGSSPLVELIVTLRNTTGEPIVGTITADTDEAS